MFGLSLTKTVRHAEGAAEEARACELEASTESRKRRGELATLLMEHSATEVGRRAAEERAQEAEQRLTALKGSMPKRFRVGWVDIEPAKLTAQLRGVAEGGLRVELDGYRLWVYSDRPLKEAEVNAVQARLPFTMDRT